VIDTAVGNVFVQTTSNRGFTPEEVAERCLERIVSVAEDATPEVRAQAQAFKDNIRKLLVYYMKEAIKSDRTTVYNALCDAGQKDLAELIRRL
jgi:hypothetical protein